MSNIPINCPYCGNILHNSDHSVASSKWTTLVSCPNMFKDHWIITTKDLSKELSDLLFRGIK
jgi:hypothetical protein